MFNTNLDQDQFKSKFSFQLSYTKCQFLCILFIFKLNDECSSSQLIHERCRARNKLNKFEQSNEIWSTSSQVQVHLIDNIIHFNQAKAVDFLQIGSYRFKNLCYDSQAQQFCSQVSPSNGRLGEKIYEYLKACEDKDDTRKIFLQKMLFPQLSTLSQTCRTIFSKLTQHYNLRQCFCSQKSMEALKCEEIFAAQCLRMRLEKSLAGCSSQEVVRLPLEIYRYTIQVFRKEQQIASFFLQAYTKEFYLKKVEDLEQAAQSQPDNLYFKLLKQLDFPNDQKKTTLILSQIMVRVLILGLSVKIGIPAPTEYRSKFKHLIKDLQIELIFKGESLSDLVIRKLEELKQNFDFLQFYEELLKLFDSLDNISISRWLEGQLADLKKRFEEKSKSSIPLQPQINTEAKQKVRKINKRATMNERYSICPQNTSDRSLLDNENNSSQPIEPPKETKTPAKVNKDKTVSTIALANQMRKSISRQSTHLSFSTKYVFKSNKKKDANLSTQIQYEYEEEVVQQEKRLPAAKQENRYSRQSFVVYKQYHQEKQDSNSKMICPATPPRTNRKKFG